MGENLKDIFTERLILRRYKECDYDALKEMWLGYMATHKKIQKQDVLLIDSWIENYSNKEYCWIAADKKSRCFIGNINVLRMSRKHNNCELGYAVKFDKRQQGYATEMLKSVINYLLNEESFHVVEASHYSGNPNSGKVMKKAGMKKEAELRDRRYNFVTGKYENLVCYCVVSDKYNGLVN